MKRTQLNLQISEYEERLLELFSVDISKSKSHIVRMAIEILTHFDFDIWEQLEKLAQKVDFPIWALIQNLVIAKLAEIQEDPHGTDLSIFVKMAGKPYTGNELLKSYRSNLRLRKEDRRIIGELQASGYLEPDQVTWTGDKKKEEPQQ
jgi:hypothetical protein